MDVPEQLYGSIRLRSLENYNQQSIMFYSPVNITVYIAFDWTKPNPLSKDWIRTDYEFSILELDEGIVGELMKFGKSKSKSQIDLAVYRNDFNKGYISWKFNIDNKDFYNLQILLLPNYQMKNYTCGGKSTILSLSDDKNSMFAGCQSSSSLNDEYNCFKGFSNNGMWKTDNEGIYSFIIIKFINIIRPTHI